MSHYRYYSFHWIMASLGLYFAEHWQYSYIYAIESCMVEIGHPSLQIAAEAFEVLCESKSTEALCNASLLSTQRLPPVPSEFS